MMYLQNSTFKIRDFQHSKVIKEVLRVPKAAKEARRKGKKVVTPNNEAQNASLLSMTETQKQHLEQNQMEQDWKMQRLLEQNQQKWIENRKCNNLNFV